MNDQDKKDAKAQALIKQMVKTEVDKDQVVGMVGNLLGMLGNMGGRTSNVLPPASAPASKTQTSDSPARIKHIERVLSEAAEEDDINQLRNDEQFMFWIKREGCKQKTYDEELELVRQIIAMAGEKGDFELAIIAAEKAISMARIHSRSDDELLSELYWVKSELYATTGNMQDALRTVKLVVAIVDPDADEDSETYKELVKQLEASRARTASG